jgi:hypothetical protein
LFFLINVYPWKCWTGSLLILVFLVSICSLLSVNVPQLSLNVHYLSSAIRQCSLIVLSCALMSANYPQLSLNLHTWLWRVIVISKFVPILIKTLNLTKYVSKISRDVIFAETTQNCRNAPQRPTGLVKWTESNLFLSVGHYFPTNWSLIVSNCLQIVPNWSLFPGIAN